jgi:Carboxypeptidase regulatory-like domain
MRLVLCLSALALVSSAPIKAGATTVRGAVMDQSGGAIVGASVGLYTDLGNWETQIDESGRFVLENVPPGHYELEVKSPGFLVHFNKDYEVGTTAPPSVLVTLIPGSNPPCGQWFHGADGPCYFGGATTYLNASGKPALTGTVFILDSSGGRLNNAEIVLTKMGQKQLFVESRTDEKGQFRFADLDVGRYEVWVKHEGCSDSGASNVRIKYGKIADLTIYTRCSPSSR